MSVAEALNEIEVVHGTFRPHLLTVQCLIRNEMFFLPSFLAHYRALGVGQFAFLDDGSTDGSFAFLAEQDDCVVLRWRFSYGTHITLTDAPIQNKTERAGILARTLIAKRLGITGWALGVDADEYLLLPRRHSDLASVTARLDERGAEILKASLVEFYPEKMWPASPTPASPASFGDMVDQYPYFDARQLIDVSTGKEVLVAPTASMRLFRQYGIRGSFPGYFPPARLFRWLSGDPPRTPAHKTPLVRWAEGTFLQGSHLPGARTPTDLLLGMAHFKFTRDLDRRTAGAIATRAYAGKSLRYDCYDALIEKMRRTGGTFLGPASRRFQSVEDFLAAGLMQDG